MPCVPLCQMWVHREQMLEPSLGLHQDESLHNTFSLFLVFSLQRKGLRHTWWVPGGLALFPPFITSPGRPGKCNNNIKENKNEAGGARERSWGGVLMSENMASCSSVKSAVAAHVMFFVPINRSKLSACTVCQQILSKEHMKKRRKCSLLG